MTSQEFNNLNFGNFRIDERLVNLDKKLIEYYAMTENLDDRNSYKLWISVKLWCYANGYTQDEINSSKRRTMP